MKADVAPSILILFALRVLSVVDGALDIDGRNWIRLDGWMRPSNALADEG